MLLGIKNCSRGTVLGSRIRLADGTWTRLAGLLNRARLDPGEGLWIMPSSAIHTMGMRFSIDAVFLEKMQAEKRRRVKRIYHCLAPWRMTGFVWGAESVLELPAGTVEASKTEVGDELEIQRQE